MQGYLISGVSGRAGLLLRAMMLSTTLGGAALMPSQAVAQSTERQFDIPAQSLGDALMAFGRQSGMQVTAEGRLVEGRNSSAVSGRIAPAQALSQLLAGSGLTFRYVGNNAVRLERAPQAADGAVLLGPVRVEGQNAGGTSLSGGVSIDPGQTEGSGSYNAPVVTLGKMPARRRDIPQSISVITRQQIDDQNLTSLTDVMKQVAGIYVNDFGDATAGFYSRGYSVGAMQDGLPVYRSLNGAVQLDLALYDRVEMMRGPAGLLNGPSNTGSGMFGGTVNLVRKRPLDHFALSGGVQLGSWNGFHGDVDVTGPLNASGTIRGRLIVAGEDRDYFYDGAHNKMIVASGLLDIDLTPDTVLALVATIHRRTISGRQPILPVNSDGSIPNYRRSASTGADWNKYNYPFEEYTAELRHQFSESWKFVGTLRYHDNDRSDFTSTYLNVSGYADPASGTVAYWGRSINFAGYNLDADAHLEGSFQALGQEQQVMLGANYNYMTYDGYSAYGYLEGLPIVRPDIPRDALADRVFGFSQIEKQWGIYGSTRLRPVSGLTLVMGGRLSSVKNRYSDETGTVWTVFADEKWRFMPYGGIVVDVTKNVSAYGSYSEIFEPQSTRDFNDRTLAPRTGWQVEVGVKGDFLDDNLHATLAMFRIEDRNRPVVDSDPAHVCDSGSCYVAAGLIRNQGIEAEVSGQPTPAWNITASYTYNSAKYREDSDTALIGRLATPEQPRHTAKLWTNYRFGDASDGWQGWNLGGGLRYQGATYGNGGAFRIAQGSFVIADAQLGYRFSQGVSVTASLNNLFDKRYYEVVSSSTVRFGTPRNFLITLRGAI